MDIEWKPSYARGEYNKTSLLQLSNGEITILFRLHMLEKEGVALHLSLKELLEHPSIIKTGVGVEGDAKRLFTDYGIKVTSRNILNTNYLYQVGGIAEISSIPLIRRCKPKSLQGLSALFLGYKQDKTNQMTNWEKPSLTQQQLDYAGKSEIFTSRSVMIQ
jgi:hypothetical protein